MAKKYHPIGFDNRGTYEKPFGFVYLSRSRTSEDNSGRIGYGANRDNPHPLAVWVCRDTPNDISASTVRNVQEFLAAQFPHLAERPDEISGLGELPDKIA